MSVKLCPVSVQETVFAPALAAAMFFADMTRPQMVEGAFNGLPISV